MAAKDITEAIYRGIMAIPLASGLNKMLALELRDFFAHAHIRHINKLRKEGKPFETANDQIREFLDEIFRDIDPFGE